MYCHKRNRRPLRSLECLFYQWHSRLLSGYNETEFRCEPIINSTQLVRLENVWDLSSSTLVGTDCGGTTQGTLGTGRTQTANVQSDFLRTRTVDEHSSLSPSCFNDTNFLFWCKKRYSIVFHLDLKFKVFVVSIWSSKIRQPLLFLHKRTVLKEDPKSHIWWDSSIRE